MTSSNPRTVDSLRKNIHTQLKYSASFDGDSFLESFLIVEQVLGKSKAQIITDTEEVVSVENQHRAQEIARLRISGMPMAYLLGYKDFYKSRFSVEQGVLIPRPETELVVEKALETANFGLVADLGCGSGCIGISLLLEKPGARLWACDVAPIAIQVTKQNATQLGVTDRINYETGDVLSLRKLGEFDLIVSNPPYIDKADTRVEKNVRVFEPGLALFAEENGLRCYQQWIPWSEKALKPGGKMIFEFGEGQAPAIQQICEAAGLKKIKIFKDFAQIERVVVAEKAI